MHHKYYLEDACRAFIIKPTSTCLQLLKGYGLQFKPYKGGAAILGEQVKDASGSWIMKKTFNNIEPLKFSFLIEKAKDYSTFEKATFLDDFVNDNNELGILGKQIYYFDNLNNSTAKIRRSTTAIELSDDNNSVNGKDRVWLISEVLKLKPSITGQVTIKFKKVFDAPNSDRLLATFLMVQNNSVGLSMNELYRKLINQGVINENEKEFPTIPEGLYNMVAEGGHISKIYTEGNINFQNVWGIIELFENRDSVVSRVEMRISFEEKNVTNRFNDIDKGTGGYPKSEFYNYFITNGNAYNEKVKYPDF